MNLVKCEWLDNGLKQSSMMQDMVTSFKDVIFVSVAFLNYCQGSICKQSEI